MKVLISAAALIILSGCGSDPKANSITLTSTSPKVTDPSGVSQTMNSNIQVVKTLTITQIEGPKDPDTIGSATCPQGSLLTGGSCRCGDNQISGSVKSTTITDVNTFNCYCVNAVATATAFCLSQTQADVD